MKLSAAFAYAVAGLWAVELWHLFTIKQELEREAPVFGYPSAWIMTSAAVAWRRVMPTNGGSWFAPGGAREGSPELGVRSIISKVLYINLERSQKRRVSMIQQLENLKDATQLQYERFPAVEKNSTWVKQKLENPPALLSKQVQDSSLWPGILANWASHLHVWQKILTERGVHTDGEASGTMDGNEPAPYYALVLEDDALIGPHSLDSLSRHLAAVPADADIILLDYWGYARPLDRVGAGVYKAAGPFWERWGGAHWYYYAGMHAYLVRHASLPRLIRHYQRMSHYEPDPNTVFSRSCRKYALTLPGIGLTNNSKQSDRLGPR